MNRREEWLEATGASWVEATMPVRDFAKTLHGLGKSAARSAAESMGYQFRVTMIDGVPQTSKMDRRARRINARLVDGMVLDTTIG